MIVTLNKTFAPLNDVKLIGLRERECTEFYEFSFVFEDSVVKSHNTQFRLVLDEAHPGLDALIKSGHAMDPTRFANKRAKELQEASRKGQVGEFVQPTFWAIVPQGTEVVPDYTEIKRRAQDVLGNHGVVDAMRSPVSGNCSLQEDGIDAVIITIASEGRPEKKLRFPLKASDIVLNKEVFGTEPLFVFATNPSLAAQRWVTDKISQGATTEIATAQGKQLAYDIDLIMHIPSDSFIWFDAGKNERYFSMPARWSSRHIRFEAKSPHRTTALRAAGVLQAANV